MTRDRSTRFARVGRRLVAGVPGSAGMWVETLAQIGAGWATSDRMTTELTLAARAWLWVNAVQVQS